MFDGLARLAARWPRSILVGALVFIGLCLLYGSGVGSGLQTGGQTALGSQSSQAEALLQQKFAAGQPNLVLLVNAPAGADNPAVAAEGRALTAQLAGYHGRITAVGSYWNTHSPLLKAKDGKSALIVGYIEGSENQQRDFINLARPALAGTHGPVDVQFGGTAVVNQVQTYQVRADIAAAEKIGIPLTALVLIIAFSSQVASLLPLLVGLLAYAGTIAELRVITTFTDVSVFALNLATGLATGLAADYGLFIVKRYRDEYHAGVPIPEAIRITLNTAGRTVLYSSLTVAVALSSMLVFPLYFLRSFAYAGIAVVLLASAASLIVLPAGMLLLGKHIDALDYVKIFRRLTHTARTRTPRPPGEPNYWQRAAELVMRRALLCATALTAILAIAIIPFLHVNFGLPDDRILPANTESHIVQDTLRTHYDGQITNRLEIVADAINPATHTTGINAYAEKLSTLPGVVRVDAATGIYQNGHRVQPPGPATTGYSTHDATYMDVATSYDQVSKAAQTQITDIRALPAPFPVQVGGANADLKDALTGLAAALPWAALIIITATLTLIFTLTGGLLLALETLLMNILGLGATFGALVWVFQEGHLSTLLGFTPTGNLDVSLIVLLFCVAFGVSMDFQVFLISRIKEEYKRTGGNNRQAVAFGMAKTGSVVTAAATITSVVFIAIGLTSHVTTIKMFGWGLALALLLDATLIRTILVPSLMKLAGQANWWHPTILNSLYEHLKLKDEHETERETEHTHTTADH